MENFAANSKPGIVLVLSALVLLGLSTFLFHAFAMRQSADSAYALGYALTRGVLAPAIAAGIFCVPKKSRTYRRFTVGFIVVSVIMLFLALGEVGQSATQ
jgi:hypothetical protein